MTLFTSKCDVNLFTGHFLSRHQTISARRWCRNARTSRVCRRRTGRRGARADAAGRSAADSTIPAIGPCAAAGTTLTDTHLYSYVHRNRTRLHAPKLKALFTRRIRCNASQSASNASHFLHIETSYRITIGTMNLNSLDSIARSSN